jgi:signal peptidase I
MRAEALSVKEAGYNYVDFIMLDEHPTPSNPKAPRGVGTVVTGWVRDLVISLFVSAFIIVFLYQPVKVEGTSMLPGLSDQERIFVNKFVYHLEDISRGDIVVFRYPRDPSKSYIKRVIAVGGDRVRIEYGRVYVNGYAIYEPYVPLEFLDARSYPETIVPEGYFFVLGDHRSASSDSRDFGAVARNLIYGKAVFSYWPVEKLGLLH